MKTKEEIVENWLPRYTGTELEDFGKYILLVNFSKYVEMFAEKFKVPINGNEKAMQSATANNITIINFGMGSANAATIMDLLSAIHPKAVLFLGKCGGLKKKNNIGDLILPIAAIRGEELREIISLKKYLHYLPLTYKKLFLPLYAITTEITGQELFILPTAGYGNTMMNLKIIFVQCEAWQLIWKLPPFSSWVFTIIFLRVLCCWFRTNL